MRRQTFKGKLSQDERESRNSKIAKLYNEGLTPAILALRFDLTQNRIGGILRELRQAGRLTR